MGVVELGGTWWTIGDLLGVGEEDDIIVDAYDL